LEKLSSCLARFNHKQRQEQIDHLGSHNQSEVVELACILWIAQMQQQFERFK